MDWGHQAAALSPPSLCRLLVRPRPLLSLLTRSIGDCLSNERIRYQGRKERSETYSAHVGAKAGAQRCACPQGGACERPPAQ